MEAVVSLGQPFVVADHEIGTKLVVRAPDFFEAGVAFVLIGKWEGLEAIGRSVCKVVFERCAESSRPDFVCAALQYRKFFMPEGEDDYALTWNQTGSVKYFV
jgi:hypothetical protein